MDLGETMEEYWSGSDWLWDDLVKLLPQEALNRIAAHSIMNEEIANNFYWGGSSSGKFLVSSALEIIRGDTENNNAQLWKAIWSVKAPPRIRNFLCLVAYDCILTNTNREGSDEVGAGGVIRDHEGIFVQAGYSTFQAELLRIIQGVVLAQELGIGKMMVECDSRKVFSTLTKEDPPGASTMAGVGNKDDTDFKKSKCSGGLAGEGEHQYAGSLQGNNYPSI
ncbi:hypothetical protein V2J09_002224 [Rumex salicifolius]